MPAPVCPNCGQLLERQETLGRESRCPHCKHLLHVCDYCTFFDVFGCILDRGQIFAPTHGLACDKFQFRAALAQ